MNAIATLEPVRKRAKGAGRKPKGSKTLEGGVHSVRVTEAERACFESLGGASWMRKSLLIAKVLEDATSGRYRATCDDSKLTTKVQFRLTQEQAAKFHALGGSAWLRQQLSRSN
ncbi:hypothetical protein [Geopseudomonas aromaticivorans]